MNYSSHPFRTVKRVLLMGAFSTVGDIEVLRQVQGYISDLGLTFDIAPFSRRRVGTFSDWRDASTLDPSLYSHVLFICGPFTKKMMTKRWRLLQRFSHCAFIGVNLTMIASPTKYNPFEFLIERDSSEVVRPDLSFVFSEPAVPVLGLCLVESQREYEGRAMHKQAQAMLESLISRNNFAVVQLDTRILPNPLNKATHGFFNTAQYESVVARLDAVLTTRLHGMVLSLKNSVPVIAIDAISGGDKVSRQAAAIGWNEAFLIDHVTDLDLDSSLARCLSPTARDLAGSCAERAREYWYSNHHLFAKAFDVPTRGDLRAALPSGFAFLRPRVAVSKFMRAFSRHH